MVRVVDRVGVWRGRSITLFSRGAGMIDLAWPKKVREWTVREISDNVGNGMTKRVNGPDSSDTGMVKI